MSADGLPGMVVQPPRRSQTNICFRDQDIYIFPFGFSLCLPIRIRISLLFLSTFNRLRIRVRSDFSLGCFAKFSYNFTVRIQDSECCRLYLKRPRSDLILQLLIFVHWGQLYTTLTTRLWNFWMRGSGVFQTKTTGILSLSSQVIIRNLMLSLVKQLGDFIFARVVFKLEVVYTLVTSILDSLIKIYRCKN